MAYSFVPPPGQGGFGRTLGGFGSLGLGRGLANALGGTLNMADAIRKWQNQNILDQWQVPAEAAQAYSQMWRNDLSGALAARAKNEIFGDNFDFTQGGLYDRQLIRGTPQNAHYLANGGVMPGGNAGQQGQASSGALQAFLADTSGDPTQQMQRATGPIAQNPNFNTGINSLTTPSLRTLIEQYGQNRNPSVMR